MRQQWLEVLQRPGIDPSLKRNHVPGGVPEIHPAIIVELRLIDRVETKNMIVSQKLQKKPDLLLANTNRLLVSSPVAARQAIAQPAGRGAEHAYVVRQQTRFLCQLAIHRLNGRLIGVHATLRELPT